MKTSLTTFEFVGLWFLSSAMGALVLLLIYHISEAVVDRMTARAVLDAVRRFRQRRVDDGTLALDRVPAAGSRSAAE